MTDPSICFNNVSVTSRSPPMEGEIAGRARGPCCAGRREFRIDPGRPRILSLIDAYLPRLALQRQWFVDLRPPSRLRRRHAGNASRLSVRLCRNPNRIGRRHRVIGAGEDVAPDLRARALRYPRMAEYRTTSCSMEGEPGTHSSTPLSASPLPDPLSQRYWVATPRIRWTPSRRNRRSMDWTLLAGLTGFGLLIRRFRVQIPRGALGGLHV